ncbi:dinitrogenase iron-molybdenum cofactor biosynthesis protein [Candidatus Bathyarchaeota archaeon]|nr:dinitrogenase iron-molybdenum cofactor biosynthesis protein [Candidatus Bathyarchaeota archaeon]
MVIDLNEEHNPIEWKATPNVNEHFGGVGRPPDRILELRPNVLITYGMGARALAIFQSAGVAVLKAAGRTVEEVLKAFKEQRLEELTEGCLHALHR